MEVTTRDDALAALTAGIEQLASSETWQAWLDSAAKFRTYSFNNTMLILLQRPDATRVAGFVTWQGLGRQVRKGEHGIRILAPVVVKNRDEEGNSDGTRVAGFRTVSVFDVAQTDGEDLPNPVEKLRGDAPADLFTALVEFAAARGYSVTLQELDGANGYCTFAARSIVVESRNDAGMRIKTLAHELAHSMLHEDENDRARAELEAESVAFVVCRALGIDSAAYSFGYVTAWKGGSSEAVAAIRESAGRISTTANSILAAVVPERELVDA